MSPAAASHYLEMALHRDFPLQVPTLAINFPPGDGYRKEGSIAKLGEGGAADEPKARRVLRKGASRYDVRVGEGSWKSGRIKGGCVNFIV